MQVYLFQKFYLYIIWKYVNKNFLETGENWPR